VKNVGFKPGV